MTLPARSRSWSSVSMRGRLNGLVCLQPRSRSVTQAVSGPATARRREVSEAATLGISDMVLSCSLIVADGLGWGSALQAGRMAGVGASSYRGAAPAADEA